MRGELLTAAESVRRAAQLAQADVIHTPSLLTADIAQGAAYTAESLSSAMQAAAGTVLGGKRALLAIPEFCLDEAFSFSFMRLPLVAACLSRSPGTLTASQDSSAALAIRDAGWLMFFPCSNQEIVDDIVLAYRISEDMKVQLPSVVVIDAHPNFAEPVFVPTGQSLKTFLPRLQRRIDPKKPAALTAPPGDGYSDARRLQHAAMDYSLKAAEKIYAGWKAKFRRSYSHTENYHAHDADYVFVIAGSLAQTCRGFVDAARTRGERVGMLRLRTARPFPKDQLKLLSGKKVAVIDNAVSLGAGGILHGEVKRTVACTSALLGLGGRPVSEKHFADILSALKSGREDVVWM